MPMPPEYPKLLTAADWKDNMGLAYKMAKGKAGLSKSLRQAEQSYNKVDWKMFQPMDQCKTCMYAADYEAKKKEAITYHTVAVGTLYKIVGLIDGPCKIAIKEIKESRLIPKSTREHVAKIQAEVKKFQKRLERFLIQIDKDYTNYAASRLKSLNVAGGILKSYVSKFDAALKKMVKEASKEKEEAKKISVYDSFRTEYIRGFATSLPFFRKDSDFKPAVSWWKTAAQDSGNPKSGAELDKKAKELANQFKKLKVLVDTKLKA
ncbi:Hypothetical protein PBC10988_25370 [Planctomycetales bacterium 10988]|nr:Hypothetical protein PBC10988_25370 [Planctomycetales bacterium 10988]